MNKINAAGSGRRAAGRSATLDPEQIAAEILGFLAAESERLARFFALTGLDPTEIRAAAGRRGFADAVLSYVGSDESVLIAFAEASGHRPDAIDHLVQAVAARDPDV